MAMRGRGKPGAKGKDKRKDAERGFRPLFKRRKFCRFTAEGIKEIDYKDVDLLQRFMSDRGKIRNRRVAGNTLQQQREVANAIKVAREMGLLPYAKRVASTRTGGRREGRDGGRDGGREGRDGRRDEASTETADGAAVDSVDATGGELDSVSEEV